MKRNIAFDDRDKKILTMYSRDPNVSQERIGSEIGLKQPSVAVRIRKLKDAGALEQMAGIDPFKLGLQMAKVDVTTSDPGKVIAAELSHNATQKAKDDQQPKHVSPDITDGRWGVN